MKYDPVIYYWRQKRASKTMGVNAVSAFYLKLFEEN